MTDSIKTRLSLTKLAEHVRMDIPAKICTVGTPHGVIEDRYTKPSLQKSPLSETGMKWVVRCDLNGSYAPTDIEAELNIPNAITGQNIEHGTSVFAAGFAAFELQRIWLAQHGLPREQLDLLTIDDVKLGGVTITYLFPFKIREEAVKMVKDIAATGRVLNKRCNIWSSSNDTVVLPYRDFIVKAYIKTDLSHCAWKDGSPVDSITEHAPYIVRVEVKLGRPFLAKQGLIKLDLTKLESWRDAYARDIYKKIFDETVYKELRLDNGGLRHKAPREEVFANLTETEGAMLRWYLDGRDPRQFKSILESANQSARFSDLKRPILDVARIDIGIPWAEHVKLRCFELVDQLRYPGDYHPCDEHAAWAFCESNWDNLRNQMRQAYEAAFRNGASL